MKANDTLELPLFPLNVVLFPGQTLPLHIFEPRYRVMIQKCIDEQMPFGVLLVDEDDGTPFSIGTIARITSVEELADGRMNIVTIGVERFIVDDVRMTQDNYLIGDATIYPFRNAGKPPRGLKRSVAEQLRRYLQVLAKHNGIEFKVDEFPKESSGIAVFAAIALQLPLDDKQELLATETVSELLKKEDGILRNELMTLRLMHGAIKPPQEEGVFSLN
jgi:Lon protease-like protein